MATHGSEPAGRRPWWTFALPYPGRMPPLTQRQWSLLGLLAVAELFDNYDMGIMGLALPQIQAGLDIAEADVGGVLAVVRLGMLPAFALTLMADRVGRRRLLLATILGFTCCTFATAFARDARDLMLLQFLARLFIAGETMLAVVMIAEELYARDRGFGIGMLGALGAFGHGLAAILFAFIEVLPYGWRGLYAIGVVPLLLLAWFRRTLPETQRFEAHRKARTDAGGLRGALRPALFLFRMYPGRLLALSLAIVPFSFVVGTAMAFMAKILQELHGYAPGEVTVLYLVGGGLGILGNLVAGRLGDRFGRKRVMCTGMLLNAGALAGFYNGTGLLIPPVWVLMLFTLTGVEALFKALGSELFPTSYRSTASGMRAIVSTAAGAAGLALEGALYPHAGSHALAITWMIPVLVVPPLMIALFLPETAARELEDISPERRVA